MKNEHELTEKLKKIETEIYDDKVDLKSIHLKLENAYLYEDELAQRQRFAEENTEKLRKDFFIKAGQLSEKYVKMKSVFDIFTGDFHKNYIGPE